jgi:hypothetical protein
MINHARTLLLNRKGEIIPSGFRASEEYVPVYSPVELSSALSAVYSILFGTAPDYAGKLYRTAQYMAVLHSTEFVEYVTDLDSRITYDPSDPGLLSLSWGLTVTSTASAPALTVLNDWDPPDFTGRMEHQWIVTATGSNTIEVRNVWTGELLGLVLSFGADGASNRFPLPGSDFEARISAPLGLTASQRWEILYRVPLTRGLGQIVEAVKGLSGETLDGLFGVAPAEPYLTFRNLLNGHKALPFQLSGVLLALVYRMEALRNP